MEKVGIDHYFSVGAFGDEDFNRAELVKMVIKRFEEKFGVKPSKIFLFGDTPHDMRAGKENGIVTIGVASGKYAKEELLRVRANFVLDNLKDTKRVLEIIYQ